MSRQLPIFFNTDMVQAVLDGKRATRRPVKQKYSNTEFKMKTDKYGTRLIEVQKSVEGETFGKTPNGNTWHKLLGYIEPQCQYKKRDILYVRESGMIQGMEEQGRKVKMLFAADNEVVEFAVSENEYRRLSKYEHLKRFLSPYWLTRETARIWLTVTDVRAEPLQNIKIQDMVKEGASGFGCEPCLEVNGICIPQTDEADICKIVEQVKNDFISIWNSTVKKADIDIFGWKVNPWVWVIEFEQCEKPKEVE